MTVRIRLCRAGKKNRPYHRIVVADGRFPRDGRFIEQIGTYNPLLPRESAQRVKLTLERAKHWLTVGAQPTDRVAKFFADAGLMAARPRREQTKKHLPRKKAQERAKAAAGEAPAAAPPAPAPAAS